MDFIRYAERSAGLHNASFTDVEALQAHLADRQWLVPQCTDRDCMLLRKFQRELRPVFEASAASDPAGVVDGINELMVRHPITPQISSHDPQNLHIHAASKTQFSPVRGTALHFTPLRGEPMENEARRDMIGG